MNKKIEKQLLNNFIFQELSSKLFINPKKLTTTSLTINNNFKLTDIKLIKNIIAVELLAGKRPSLTASLWKKAMIVNLKTTISIELISYLQATPIVWSKYLATTMNVTDNLFTPSLAVKNNKLLLTAITRKNNKLDLFIKSAYLD